MQSDVVWASGDVGAQVEDADVGVGVDEKRFNADYGDCATRDIFLHNKGPTSETKLQDTPFLMSSSFIFIYYFHAI